MPRSLSLTALQVNALTTSNDTILYNSQARDISLYGGTDLASTITQLEINNMSGDCLTLRFNGDANNYANFKMNSSGTFDVKINNGNKSFNIVNHDGSTHGLKLGGTLVTSTAAELNKLSGFTGTFSNLDYLTGVTPGTATASKALVTDSNNNLVGINDLSTQNLTVAGTLVTASATELNYTDIATAGTAQPAKALVVDVNKDIDNIRNLSATSLTATDVTGTNVTGTLQTASQPNITTVGTLGSLTVANQISAGSLLVNGSDISALIAANDISSGVTPGTVTASKVLLVDSSKDLTGMRNLTSIGTVSASTLTGTLSTASQPNITTLAGVTSVGASSATALTGTLQTATQSNVTSVGTLTSLTSNGNVNIASHDGSTQGLKLAGTLVTATASEMNKLSGLTASTTELNKVASVTPGTVSASKALVVDGNKDLTGIRNITTTGSITGAVGISATTLTGTLATASQPNITSVGTLGDLTVSNQINVGTLDATAILVNGVDITTAISGSDPTTGITAGVVSASKVLLVDSSKNLTGMGNLTSSGTITASTLTGTLSAGAQTGISAVGTLTGLVSNRDVNVAQHDGSTQGLKLSGTLVTATASDLNKLTNVTNGTTSASKALIVDINKDLTGIRNLTSTGTISATTLTGALSAGAQTEISAVGTLTGLVSNGDVNVAQHDGSTQGLKLQGTLVTATASDLNKLTNVTSGTVSANKALVVDTNQDLSGIRNLATTGTISGVTTLTATTLTGTLSAGAQTGISAVGTLTGLTSNGDVNIAQHDGSTKGFKLAGTLVTATATDLNKLASVTASAAELNTTAGVTAGTVTASKHLVVDSNKDLTGIRNLTSTGTISGVTTLTATTVSATTLTGTLSAGAQNNITTLTGATSVGQNSSTVLTGTLAAGAQPNITTLAGVTSVGQNSSTVLTGTLASAAQPNITSVGTLSSLALSGGISGATTISGSGILTNTNTTDSTSNSTGAVVVSGGVGISKSTDATSSTNGGALTVAGGAAIAKKLYVGTDLTVGGNLTIGGTTTTINSTTTTITDNTLLLNSGPAGTGYDAGILTQRYQIDNSAGTGDIVSDTAKETYAIASGTVSAITLPSGANATNNYYNNWWIKITSGTQLNQVRKITAYNGTTKVATLSTDLGGAPSASDNINLYNKSFTGLLWNESSKKFISAFTSNDTTTPGALTIIDYADFTAKNITGTLAAGAQNNITTLTGATSVGKNLATVLTGTLATVAQPNLTSVGTLVGLTVSGDISTSGNISTTGTGTIASVGLLTAYGGLTVWGPLSLGSVAVSTSGNISTTGTGTITSAGLLTASAGLTVTGALTGTLAAGAQNNVTTLTGATSVGKNSTTVLTGTLATAAQPNVTSVGTLTSLTASGAVSTSGNISTTGTGTITSSGLLTAYGGLNIWGPLYLGSVEVTTSGNISTTSTGTITSAGLLTASNGLTVTGTLTLGSVAVSTSGNISTTGTGTITSAGLLTASAGLTVTGALTGTLATAAQPNVTSVGTLTGLTASGNISTSGVITSTAAGQGFTHNDGTINLISYVNYAVTGGYAYFGTLTNHALALQTNNLTRLTISNSGYITCTGSMTVNNSLTVSGSLNGTLATAAQPNVTSVGTLTGLTASGNVSTSGNISTTGTGTITSAGLLTASAGLTVNGTLTLSSISTSGNISTTGTGTITSAGLLTASAGLTASGTVTTSGNISTTGTGTITSAGLLTASAATNTQISDAGIATLVYPLSVSHLLSSGTPTANSFGIGMLFSGPNINNTTISYARIFSTCQASTLNAQQGNLTISTVFGGNFIDAITISSSSATSSTLTINGASSSLSLPGASAILSIANITASTSSSTGALQVAGGAYFGAASLMAANLTLNGTSSTLSISGASAKLTIANTTASTSSSTGALQVAGGAYFGTNSLFGGAISFSVRNTGKVSTTLPASCISLLDNPIYMRGSGGDDKNHFIGYCGNSNQTTWNTGKGFGNPATANDGPVICGNNNVIIGTLAGSSTETICANFTSTGLALGGGSPTCRLDLGLTASNMGINLYGGTFGLGAMNGFLNYYGNTSHKWWNTSDDVRLGVSQGTNTMTLNGTGDLAVSGSYLWTPGTSGTYGGLKFNVAGTGNATLQTFMATGDCGIGTTSAHPFGLLTNGSYRMYISSSGYVGINTLTPQYPLHVGSSRATGDASYNYYYYLGPGSTNGSTTTTPANISLKTEGRILVSGGEIDIVSDIRMKENIKCLDLNYCKSFLNIIKPVSFNYKTDTCDINYGYIAQEIIKNNFTELITIHSDDTMEEFIDNDGFKSEAGKLYSVSKNDIIPILHTVIKDQQTKITNLEQKNIDLESRLARLEEFVSTLEITE